MEQQLKDGAKAIRNTLQELKDAGYIIYSKKTDGSGTYELVDNPNVQNGHVQNVIMTKRTRISNKEPIAIKIDTIEYEKIITDLNDKLGTKYKVNSTKTKELIRARHKEGFVLEDFYTVLDNKFEEWGSDPKMRKFLRPETLYGTKFESYLNQVKETRKQGGTQWIN
jgi:uncharacterized phage protein (TIGR02220 family)